MKLSGLKYLFFVSLFLVLFACKKDKNQESSIDYSYFPDQTGMWYIYNIEYINIDRPLGIFDTTRYQIKEIIESKYFDDTGNEAMRIERYKRDDENSAWEIKDVWSACLLNLSLHKTEENVKYIKLIFPVSEGKKWDGNAYNQYENQIYEITEIDVPATINQNDFDSVLTVTQANDSSLIDKTFIIEKYAKNVGLIYRQAIDIFSNTTLFNPNLPIEQRVSTGTFYKQELIQYGN
ncbi:MAG: hypothetical protein ABIJ97_05275 [Bacteroidota bacterium]